MPRVYLALNPDDAAREGLGDGDEAVVFAAGQELRLPVRADPSLAPGLAGVPVGLPGQTLAVLPEYGTIRGAGR